MSDGISDYIQRLDIKDIENKNGSVSCEVTKQTHYTQFKIQPLQFISANGLDFMQGNVVKYVCRYKLKNGIEDLNKAKHYIEKMIEKELTGEIKL